MKTPFQTRQRDQLHRVEADRAEPDCLTDGEAHDIARQGLHQPQHLDELTLAAIAHPRFQKMAQVLECLGQVPALERRRLVERVRLALNQRQIVQRIGDEHAGPVAARMPGDLLAPAQDHDLLDEALRHHVLEAIGRRHRVVVRPIADQRRRRDPPATLLARLQRHSRQGAQGFKIGHEPFANRLRMPTGPLKTIGEFPLEVGLHTDVVVGVVVTIAAAQ